ncbi:MAG: hypothetical protein KF729_23270 [Sandaracinaceae bacterium]|nr:hypothetical protein [Sandaracinaceae bacterium]
MRRVFESPWYHLDEAAPSSLWLRRTSEPFPSLAELDRVCAPVLAEIARRAPARLLTDLREAPSRNDPEFEERFAPYRAQMTRAAARNAVLVRSRVGALQIRRLAQRDDADLEVFHEDADAREWLTRG